MDLTSIVSNKLNPALQKLPLFIPLGPQLEYSLAMVGDPVYATSFFSFGYDGGFYVKGNEQTAPFEPPSTPSNCTSQMINIILTDYEWNSCGYVLNATGALDFLVTPLNAPAAIEPLLNTSHWKRTLSC